MRTAAVYNRADSSDSSDFVVLSRNDGKHIGQTGI